MQVLRDFAGTPFHLAAVLSGVGIKFGVRVNPSEPTPAWLANGIKPVLFQMDILLSPQWVDETSGAVDVSPELRRFSLKKYFTPTLAANPAQYQTDANGNPDNSQQVYYFEGTFELNVNVNKGDYLTISSNNVFTANAGFDNAHVSICSIYPIGEYTE